MSVIPTIGSTWDAITGKPPMCPMVHSHSMSDVTGLQAWTATLQTMIPTKLSQLTNDMTLSYTTLNNKPTLFSGVYADLTGKPTLFSGAYADLTGKPVIRRQEIYSGTTDATGVYTVVFATPFTVAPNIQTRIVNGAYNQVSKVVVTATGFTVSVGVRATATLLNVEVLLAAVNVAPNVTVDVLVTAKQ